MKQVVNRGDGTLIIEKSRPCKAERREEMYYMLERMTELERLVKVGRNAEKNLKELEEDFRKFCEMEVEQWEK
ncbi:hypothetical protein [Schnuerera sp.]|uniref:hypothetical protein n=1 Tax=Schnuerera sp. TaxID=2794844 RepID=UPI002C7E4449|nr:hypothetical protein [Schnuerera sp.]HSH36022.1 hypothetical protein [Schnuerera sp.]